MQRSFLIFFWTTSSIGRDGFILLHFLLLSRVLFLLRCTYLFVVPFSFLVYIWVNFPYIILYPKMVMHVELVSSKYPIHIFVIFALWITMPLFMEGGNFHCVLVYGHIPVFVTDFSSVFPKLFHGSWPFRGL